MIRHVVLLALSDTAASAELAEVMAGLGDLVGRIKGFETFEHGPNRDLEGKTPGYPYGFVAGFADIAALERYAADPRHQVLGARLVALCAGGAEGILVMDLEVGA